MNGAAKSTVRSQADDELTHQLTENDNKASVEVVTDTRGYPQEKLTYRITLSVRSIRPNTSSAQISIIQDLVTFYDQTAEMRATFDTLKDIQNLGGRGLEMSLTINGKSIDPDIGKLAPTGVQIAAGQPIELALNGSITCDPQNETEADGTIVFMISVDLVDISTRQPIQFTDKRYFAQKALTA